MDADVYIRPDKPLSKPIKNRGELRQVRPSFDLFEPVFVDASTECHVTHSDIAKRMVSYLDIRSGSVLEPHGGMGALINALLEFGITSERITTVEKNIALSCILRNTFQKVNVVNDCFLEFGINHSCKFNHVIMNPPFKSWRKHILMAMSMLTKSKGDSLVALLPLTAELEGFREVEILSENAFSWAKVRTKIVLLEY